MLSIKSIMGCGLTFDTLLRGWLQAKLLHGRVGCRPGFGTICGAGAGSDFKPAQGFCFYLVQVYYIVIDLPVLGNVSNSKALLQCFTGLSNYFILPFTSVYGNKLSRKYPPPQKHAPCKKSMFQICI